MDILLGVFVASILLLAHDFKCAILGRKSLFKYSFLLPRPKLLVKRKIGGRTMRVIRIPKGQYIPAPDWFRADKKTPV